jgi:hypothetical protein
MEKKIILVIKNLETEQNDLQQFTVFCEERYKCLRRMIYLFLLIKSKQNYKTKFSTNLILKKELANIILE